jgi:hypothetical protein
MKRRERRNLAAIKAALEAGIARREAGLPYGARCDREKISRILGGTPIGAPLEYALDAHYGVAHPSLLRDGASEEERGLDLPGVS